MFRFDAPLFWAFFSTLSAASSTAVYLWAAYKTPWSAGFIQLYSTLGMISGWTNTVVYFFCPHVPFLQSRKAAIIIYLGSIVATATMYALLFHASLSGKELFFLSGALIPILYANSFGLQFSEGNYPWPYKRVILFNLLLLFAALASLGSDSTRDQIFTLTGSVGLLFACLWIFDNWNRVESSQKIVPSVRPWLNPSVPILERTLWDQWVLSQYQSTNLSFIIYLLGRCITFSGNFAFSYFIGQSLHLGAKIRKLNRIGLIVGFLGATSLGALGFIYPYCSLLLGQLFSWTLGSILTIRYKEPTAKKYHSILFLWILDLAGRILSRGIFSEFIHYSHSIIFISATSFLVAAYLNRDLFAQNSKLRV